MGHIMMTSLATSKQLLKMNFTPFEIFEISTSLSKDSVLTVLDSRIASTSSMNLRKNQDSYKDYEGTVDKDGFKFKRIVKTGYNAFVPMVYGTVEEKGDGSRITFKVTFSKYVNIFGIAFLLFNISLFVLDQNLSSFLFIAIPYILATLYYNIESQLLKQEINSMFNRKAIANKNH